MSLRLLTVSIAVALLFSAAARAAIQVDFEELTQFTGTNLAGGGSFYNGNNGSGTTNSDGWTSRSVHFSNNYDGSTLPLFDSWSGWGYSNVVNPITAGFTNQYAAFPGGGSNGSGGVAPGGIYAIAFGSGAYFNIPDNYQLLSLDITNTTYAALAIRDGDMFTEKFGGASGNDPDLFQVTFTGYDSLGATGNAIGSVAVPLADFRFNDNSLDFIVSQWQTVDLSSLAAARSVGLSFFSTDVGPFGINTPTYAAVDNIRFNTAVVPEPSGLLLGIATLAGAIFARRRHLKTCC